MSARGTPSHTLQTMSLIPFCATSSEEKVGFELSQSKSWVPRSFYSMWLLHVCCYSDSNVFAFVPTFPHGPILPNTPWSSTVIHCPSRSLPGRGFLMPIFAWNLIWMCLTRACAIFNWACHLTDPHKTCFTSQSFQTEDPIQNYHIAYSHTKTAVIKSNNLQCSCGQIMPICQWFGDHPPMQPWSGHHALLAHVSPRSLWPKFESKDFGETSEALKNKTWSKVGQPSRTRDNLNPRRAFSISPLTVLGCLVSRPTDSHIKF